MIMTLDAMAAMFDTIGAILWGWPLIIFIATTGLVFTIVLWGVQFRYFFTAWQYLLAPASGDGARMSPFQAFLNTLSSSLGNGSLAGMATAIYSGGPGAAFWVFVIGFLSMPIRFAEVFCGTNVSVRLADGSLRGGPLAYIQQAPGGSVLVYVYVVSALWLTLTSGCAMQAQSITGGLVNVTGLSAYYFAAIILFFLVYILIGGGARVLQASDIIVPVKVLLFFVATIIAMLYHSTHLWEALRTIMSYAFSSSAMQGGVIGYTMQGAIRYGMARVSNAAETGLGTAGILYGATGSMSSVRTGIASMVTTFVSNILVCFVLMVLIVASGAWQSNIQGIGMTIVAYSTVFGIWGSMVVTALSMMFGLGVLVTYIYIGRECWSFLFGNNHMWLFSLVYLISAAVGALANVALIWASIDVACAGLLAINLYALWLQLPVMRAALRYYVA